MKGRNYTRLVADLIAVSVVIVLANIAFAFSLVSLLPIGLVVAALSYARTSADTE